MAEYNFNQDIDVGERGELVLIKEFNKKGLKLINDNKDNKYDIKMETPSGRETTLEVKTDVWCAPGRHLMLPFGKIWVEPKDSGNLFIEFQSRNKPSGIAVTQAETFIYYFPFFKKYWSISVSELKKLIKENDFRETKDSGDLNSDTRGYLIPREEYKEYFKVFTIDYEWEK